MQLVLDTHNIALRQRNRSFYVTAGKERRMISPHRISSIAVISPCTITSAAILLAVEHKIPIIFFDHSGDPEAQVWSTQFGNLAELRRAQVLFGLSEGAPKWAAEVFRLKTAGQLDNLAWALARPSSVAAQAGLQKAVASIQPLHEKLLAATQSQVSIPALMSLEAVVARHYWPAWGAAAPAGFQCSARSRRPAVDMYNAALNYLYGMLYHVTEGAVLSAGMDPMFGFIHADEFGAPTLVFDLIEPFRPYADRLLTTLFYDSKLDNRHFEAVQKPPATNGISLTREGRKIVIAAFNDHLRETVAWRGETNTLKNHIHILAGELATLLKQFWENDPSGKLRHRRQPSAGKSGK